MQKLAIISIFLVTTFLSLPVHAEVSMTDISKGKMLSYNRKKGNCLACHVIADGDLAGNAGPPLISMKARYPDKKLLKQQIYDARIKNPNTLMPPFGAHQILTNKELDLVVEFIYSL